MIKGPFDPSSTTHTTESLHQPIGIDLIAVRHPTDRAITTAPFTAYLLRGALCPVTFKVTLEDH